VIDVQPIIDTAREAAGSESLDLGEFHIVPTRAGVKAFDLTGDAYRDKPHRKTGTTTVRDVPSFLAFYGKHASPDAEVYADRDASSITAILDAHEPFFVGDGDLGSPEWQGHRVALELRHSEAFTAWRTVSGKPMTQLAFAEFVEDHRADIREPDAATVLEMAQTFQATNKVSFKSSQILQTGQRQLSYVEQIDASAGTNGKLVIPNALQLALPIYEGATVADAVTARLRFRIDTEGRLLLIVILDQLDDVLRAAFEGVVADVTEGVPVPVLRGKPA
jgi:uncharacterized protein YfdQ (DUF2303 family)